MKSVTPGFALIGLLVVSGILVGLFVVVFYISSYGQHSSGNSQRRVDVNSLLNAIGRYRQDHNGSAPAGITQTPKLISSISGGNAINLCQALAPYVATIPIDPVGGLIVPNNASCSQQGARYNSGYTIHLNPEGAIIISAPSAEGGEQIFASE